MKERPILFSEVMATAEREGRKTQTRRVMNPQPPSWVTSFGYSTFTPKGSISGRGNYGDEGPAEKFFRCPYGVRGDLLWVRENFYQFGHWEPIEGVLTKRGKQKWRFVPDRNDVLFEGAWLREARVTRDREAPATPRWHKRLGRFMPRKYSLRTLEVTEVRVERVQDISEADAIAEGIEVCRDGDSTVIYGPHGCYTVDACDEFRRLWHSINGAESWLSNPWVWVVSFKAVGQ